MHLGCKLPSRVIMSWTVHYSSCERIYTTNDEKAGHLSVSVNDTIEHVVEDVLCKSENLLTLELIS